MYSIVVQFSISVFILVVLSICNCLRFLIYCQSLMKGVFNIMPRPKTSWTGVDCNVVWYMLWVAKALASKIPDRGFSLSKYLYLSQTYVLYLL